MDVRLPERALTDAKLDALSDGAHRLWVSGLLYAVGQTTDGHIPARALRYLHPDGLRDDLVAELVDSGMWSTTKDGWVNRRYQQEQTTAADVKHMRAQSRDRQAKHRARKKQENVTLDSHGESIPDPERNALSRVTESPVSRGSEAVEGNESRDVTRYAEQRHVTPLVTRYNVGECESECECECECEALKQQPQTKVTHAREAELRPEVAEPGSRPSHEQVGAELFAKYTASPS